MHFLLSRQIHKIFGTYDIKTLDPRVLKLIELVDSAYKSADEDRQLVEHSLDISSRELESNNALVRSVVDSIDDCVMVIGNDQDVVLVNDNLMKIWPLNIHIGKKAFVELLIQIQNSLKNPAILIDMLEHVSTARGNTRIEFNNGKIFDLIVKEQIVHKKSIGAIFVLHEVTEIINKNIDLERRIKEIEKINSFMVNRELEMINLKKKLKQLEESK